MHGDPYIFPNIPTNGAKNKGCIKIYHQWAGSAQPRVCGLNEHSPLNKREISPLSSHAEGQSLDMRYRHVWQNKFLKYKAFFVEVENQQEQHDREEASKNDRMPRKLKVILCSFYPFSTRRRCIPHLEKEIHFYLWKEVKQLWIILIIIHLLEIN